MDKIREEVILETVLDHGGCVCDPPGSGEDYCTGHCYLRAEIERLRSNIDEMAENWRGVVQSKITENERLRAALYRYGYHEKGCASMAGKPCSCGLTDVREPS